MEKIKKTKKIIDFVIKTGGMLLKVIDLICQTFKKDKK